MYRFFCEPPTAEQQIVLTGKDFNHMKNVLRLRVGERVVACDNNQIEYFCTIEGYTEDACILHPDTSLAAACELPVKISLYQGLPKSDKMELIIQKAVELGAAEIIPVMTSRTIVKLDNPQKEQKKVQRWQMIAESAAKQSGRGKIPEVLIPISFTEAIKRASNLSQLSLIPYECAENATETAELLEQASSKQSIALFIGPEGGFEEQEITLAEQAGIVPITLGKRILRTETAGMMLLSILVYRLELATTRETKLAEV